MLMKRRKAAASEAARANEAAGGGAAASGGLVFLSTQQARYKGDKPDAAASRSAYQEAPSSTC